MNYLFNYRITQELQKTKTTLICRAIDLSQNKSVLLKILMDFHSSPESLENFQDEYQLLKRLSIPGVISVYEMGLLRQEDVANLYDLPTLVLEDFGGDSLENLEISGQLELTEFFKIAIKITEIITAIHAQNIVHKNINLSNIFYHPKTGEIRLIDFAIAGQPTGENHFFKSQNWSPEILPYSAPEQTGRTNHPIDYRTDFYSVGIIFYKLLTGTLPFRSKDPLELIHCHIAKHPTPPHKLQRKIPEVLSQIIMKLMAKTAEDRYQSGRGLQGDLETCQNYWKTQRTIPLFPLGTEDVVEHFQIPQKLYGREKEIKDLLNAFARITNSSSVTSYPKKEMLLITGYAGIGKTSIVQEIYQSVLEKKAYFTSGKFAQFQHTNPYSAIVEALTGLVRQLLCQSEAELRVWKDKITGALGVHASVLVQVIPELALMVGSEENLEEVNTITLQNCLYLAFQNLMRVLCTKEHPVVIFLDDLQWGDSTSLPLIELVMTDEKTQYLLLIGAYRDEINSDHPLNLTLNHLEAQGVIIHRINLQSLSFESLSLFLADTLHHPLKTLEPLTQLLQEKTDGNPFFVKQFLKTLYEEGLIYLDSSTNGANDQELGKNFTSSWVWNFEKIKEKKFTENIIDLMIHNLRKMPQKTQDFLKISACLGTEFNLKTLMITCEKSTQEILEDLQLAIEHGFLESINNESSPPSAQKYKFVHDRIQEAAYALMEETEKTQIHLKIGRLLLDDYQGESLSISMFEIVDHLNWGKEFLQDENEQLKMAELNLKTAQEAKARNAYQLGAKYLTYGLSLLGENCWKSQYELTVKFYTEIIEIEYLNTNFSAVKSLSKIALKQINHLLDKIRIYEVNIQTLSAQNELQEALNITLEVLKLLGVSLSSHPPQNMNIEELHHLPLMNDPYKLAALKILTSVWGTAIIIAPHLGPLMAFTMVRLCLEYGNSYLSPFAYAYYGFNLCSEKGNIYLGYQLGKLALDLVEKFPARDIKCKVTYVFYALIKPWQDLLSDAMIGLENTTKIGLETGDIEYTCYAAMQYSCYALFTGESLDLVIDKHEKSIHLIEGFKQEFQLGYTKIWGQLALNLSSHSLTPELLIGHWFNERIDILIFQDKKNETSLFCFYLAKTILSYFLKDPERAITYAKLAEKYEPAMASLMPRSQLLFYYSLALLALYHKADPLQQDEYLEIVNKNQKKLKILVDYAPMNWSHKSQLIQAEKARVLQQNNVAIEAYKQAIREASKNGYTHEEALAYELLGEFYLDQGMSTLAQTYLQEAYYHYKRWKAWAKIQDLEGRYLKLFTQVSVGKLTFEKSPDLEDHSLHHASKDSLDLGSIMKAYQTISDEIELDKLLAKLMKLLIQNAGAQVGYLILPKFSKSHHESPKWLIEAHWSVDEPNVSVLQSIPIENNLPIAIINYVARTKESVVFSEAIKDLFFVTNDPYITQNKPKSLLCIPLLNRGEILGILYLENNRVFSAFTEERLEILKLLSSQAAISLKNAQLYDHLKIREREMTQLLETVPVGVCLSNETGQVIYINKTGQQILGQTEQIQVKPEDLASTYQVYLEGTEQLYPTEQLPFVRALEGEMIQTDDLVIRHNQEETFLEIYSVPIRDNLGKITGALTTFQDITERKRAQKILSDYNQILEEKVNQRTEELAKTNEKLKEEINHREQVQGVLQKQLKRRLVLDRITTEIRQCFTGEELFKKTAYLLAKTFQVSRCLIHTYTFNHFPEFPIVAEYVDFRYQSIKNLELDQNYYLEQILKRDQVIAITEANNALFPPSMKSFFRLAKVKSLMLVRTSYQEQPNGIVGLYQCDYSRHWDAEEIELLAAISAQLGIAIAQAKLLEQEKQARQELDQQNLQLQQEISDKILAETALQESAQREKAMTQVIQRMRQTLDMESIYAATTSELRQVLQCDRILIYKLRSPNWGEIVAESVSPEWESYLQLSQNHPQFYESPWNLRNYLHKISEELPELEGQTYLGIEDISQSELEPNYRQHLEQLQAKSTLTVPIFCGDQFWGLLACYYNSPYHWSYSEINMTIRVSLQLGIALQQVELLEKTQKQSEISQKAFVTADAANKAKSTFLANMSHELRTPLNTILGFTQILLRSDKLLPKERDNINIINRSGLHLLTLINDILDMAKIEAGRSTFNENHFNLRLLLDDLENMFRIKAEQKGFTLTIKCDPLVPEWIRTDEVKLRQVLINLLSNAIKFTEQGSVSLEVFLVNSALKSTIHNPTETHVQFIHFSITDTGTGISSTELEIIFEAFGQSQIGRQSQEGTGLGLPISRAFVQLIGGELQVTSELGKGSIFQFDIPVIPMTPMEHFHSPKLRVIGLAPDQPSYRILVVDDQWDNRQLLVQLLQPLGFEIKEASHGQEAIKLSQTWNPHLIFMDMRMPIMDGYEATKQIKKTIQGQATAIIALTASGFENNQTMALSVGCDDFIAKPFEEVNLFEKISKHIGVKFIFEEVPLTPPPVETNNLILTPEHLKNLSPDWLLSFHQATIEGDLDSMLNLVEKLRVENPLIAQSLTTLVKKYQFKTLLNLTNFCR